jgi:integrase/recombinase XerD
MPSEDDKRNNRNWWQEHLLTRKRNKVALGLLIYQGLTTAEIDKLTENDLQLREGKVFIKGSKKSNERTLELKSHQKWR